MECVFSRRNGKYLPAPQAASRIVQSCGRKFKNSCINSWWVILLYKPHFSPYCGAQRVSYFSSQSRRISLSQVVRSIFYPFCFYSAPNGSRYPLVGGTRYCHFAGTNSKPHKVPENAASPTSRVHAVLGACLDRVSTSSTSSSTTAHRTSTKLIDNEHQIHLENILLTIMTFAITKKDFNPT